MAGKEDGGLVLEDSDGGKPKRPLKGNTVTLQKRSRGLVNDPRTRGEKACVVSSSLQGDSANKGRQGTGMGERSVEKRVRILRGEGGGPKRHPEGGTEGQKGKGGVLDWERW